MTTKVVVSIQGQPCGNPIQDHDTPKLLRLLAPSTNLNDEPTGFGGGMRNMKNGEQEDLHQAFFFGIQPLIFS